MDFFLPGMIAFWAFGQWFVLCELGERLTGRFNEIYNEISNWDLHHIPIDTLHRLPVILSGAQQPISLSGFGNIQCTRKCFKDVKLSIQKKIYLKFIQNNDFNILL